MSWHIARFRELRQKWGLGVALRQTWTHINNVIYNKTGLDDFVRYQLLVGGKRTLSWAAYVKLYNPILERKIGSGINIMDQDWDNLILLDAYRSDYFKEYSSLEGDLSTVCSLGNHSNEFVAKNFANEEYPDTVVVTSNVWYEKHPDIDDSTFYTLINPVGMENRTKTNPELVTEAALDAIEEFPDKRLIVHYMSPHDPLVGEISDKYRDEFDDSYPGMFTLYERGAATREELRQSYTETIEFIEDKVQELLESLDGKTVVSSDHGENLGEKQHRKRLLKHGNPSPECRYVPWLEIDYDERRDVTEDHPIGFDTIDERAVEERLAALGYK